LRALSDSGLWKAGTPSLMASTPVRALAAGYGKTRRMTFMMCAGDGRPSERVRPIWQCQRPLRARRLPELVAPIFRGEADFVLGSRLLGEREPGAMPFQSLFGNRLACFLMRRLFGGRYTDLGPFRAIDYQALKGLGMADRNFGWTVEMQIKATRAGLRTLEVPVPYRRRIGRSKISGTLAGTVKAGWKILYVIAKHGSSGVRKKGRGS